jgi:hypothetical protein
VLDASKETVHLAALQVWYLPLRCPGDQHRAIYAGTGMCSSTPFFRIYRSHQISIMW